MSSSKECVSNAFRVTQTFLFYSTRIRIIIFVFVRFDFEITHERNENKVKQARRSFYWTKLKPSLDLNTYQWEVCDWQAAAGYKYKCVLLNQRRCDFSFACLMDFRVIFIHRPNVIYMWLHEKQTIADSIQSHKTSLTTTSG